MGRGRVCAFWGGLVCSLVESWLTQAQSVVFVQLERYHSMTVDSDDMASGQASRRLGGVQLRRLREPVLSASLLRFIRAISYIEVFLTNATS